MTTSTLRRPHLAGARVAILLAAFGASVGLRVAIGGPGVAQSPAAGLVFAACLLGLALAAGTRLVVTRRALLTGLIGGALISAPVGLSHLLSLRPLHDAAGFASWAVVVAVVATAEEVFLRGTLYDAVDGLAGPAGRSGWGRSCSGCCTSPVRLARAPAGPRGRDRARPAAELDRYRGRAGSGARRRGPVRLVPALARRERHPSPTRARCQLPRPSAEDRFPRRPLHSSRSANALARPARSPPAGAGAVRAATLLLCRRAC